VPAPALTDEVVSREEAEPVANESILISEVIPASPRRIFSAWLDSAQHSALTGSQASVVPAVGGEHTAWDGYVQGKTLELHDGARIVQSWRTTEFPADSPDSRVEITLEPTVGGTLVTLHHTDIPAGQSDKYREGWNEYYLSRMKTYFAETGTGADDDDDDDDEPTVPLARMPSGFARTQIATEVAPEVATEFSNADADENEPTQETTRAEIEGTAEATKTSWTSAMTSAKAVAKAVVKAVTKAVRKTTAKKPRKKPKKIATKAAPRKASKAALKKRKPAAKPRQAVKAKSSKSRKSSKKASKKKTAKQTSRARAKAPRRR
jgi:uncharacterized protein YndB with AHSA1/START domain